MQRIQLAMLVKLSGKQKLFELKNSFLETIVNLVYLSYTTDLRNKTGIIVGWVPP